MSSARTLRERLRTWHIVILASVWITAVAYGQRALLNYDLAAAARGAAPARWPAGTQLSRSTGLPTIVLAAHPRCPCTRATIEELAILMARLHNQVTATVVFVHPRKFAEGWQKTDLWESASRIPGVSVIDDTDGVEATLFGAVASGQTLLYSVEGQLLFSGGIVPFRGHSGDNPGRSAIISLVSTGSSALSQTSVYGCSLHDPERATEMDKR